MHVQSPFPFTVPKTGAIITDERCSCGGLRSRHENTFAYGHGASIDAPRSCSRFTWVAWVYTTMSVPEGFQAIDDRHVVKLERENRRNIGAKGWRYEVRDLAANRDKPKFTCAAPRARTKAEGLEHAKAELAHVLKRENATIGGAS